MPDGIGRVVLAAVVYTFAAFLLYITKSPTGLDTAAVALAGPLVTAVTVYYFHTEATAAGAALSSAGAAAGIAAAAGQSTTTTTAGATFRTEGH